MDTNLISLDGIGTVGDRSENNLFQLFGIGPHSDGRWTIGLAHQPSVKEPGSSSACIFSKIDR